MTTPAPSPSPESSSPPPARPFPLWKVLLPIFGIAFASAAGGLWLKTRGPDPDTHDSVRLVEGGETPDFQLHPFGSGKPIKIRQLGSAVTLVNFWATWCEPCMQEMQSLERARSRFKSRGFDVAAVSVDESPEKVIPAALKRMGIKDLPIYIDKDQKLSELFDISALPLTFIVDRTGKVLWIHPGEKDWDSVEVQEKLGRWLERQARPE
jgi:thiol-disulfide isomerase/thioredoxin